MKGNSYLQGCLAAAVVLIVGLVPASASVAGLAAAVTHGGGIQFLANVAHEGAILRINGNGQTMTREFDRGRTPVLDLFDAKGYLLPDGIYHWELQLLPGKADAKRLRVSASKNDGRAPNAWRSLTGSFAIRGGAIASPDLREPQAATRAPAVSQFGADLAAAQPTTRADQGDSDNAVAYGGAAEVRARSANIAPAARAGVSTAADADGAPVAESIVFAPVGAARSPNSAITSAIRKRPTSADGSNGRPPQSKPNR